MIDRISRKAPRSAAAISFWLLIGISALVHDACRAGQGEPPHGRAVFLGDSITYSGQYVDFVEAGLRLSMPQLQLEVINLGLPSETVSGLTEPGHAGGAFPRPDLHERLARVLAEAQPKVVLACYGMNDGIYYPFSEERFVRFQEGIRWLHERVTGAGARIIHITPPVFDPVPIKSNTLPAGQPEYRKPFEGYNQVLDRYSEWLLEQRGRGWEVVDVHEPMNRFLSARRKHDPQFCLARDGVHIDTTGHWLMARVLLVYLGAPADFGAMQAPDQMLARYPGGEAMLRLVQQRQGLLKDAWLTRIGHRRPGMAKGLPLDEAQKQAAKLGTSHNLGQ